MSVEYLEAGWKSYSSAEIGEVLANCRKALEEVGKYVIKQGFVIKEKQFDKKEKQVMVRGPDWKKFLGSENKGDMIGTINHKIFGFVSPGAHAGDMLEMNYGYFALLQSFSLIHFVISPFKEH